VIEARKILADATGHDVANVPLSAAVGELQGWDSLAHMRLVLALEEKLARPLDGQEIITIRSLADIARLIGEA
jgi:acyl carrier protein